MRANRPKSIVYGFHGRQVSPSGGALGGRKESLLHTNMPNLLTLNAFHSMESFKSYEGIQTSQWMIRSIISSWVAHATASWRTRLFDQPERINSRGAGDCLEEINRLKWFEQCFSWKSVVSFPDFDWILKDKSIVSSADVCVPSQNNIEVFVHIKCFLCLYGQPTALVWLEIIELARLQRTNLSLSYMAVTILRRICMRF